MQLIIDGEIVPEQYLGTKEVDWNPLINERWAIYYGTDYADEENAEDTGIDVIRSSVSTSRNEPWSPPSGRRMAKKVSDGRADFTPADLASVNSKGGSFVFTNANGQSVQLTKKVAKNNFYWGAL